MDLISRQAALTALTSVAGVGNKALDKIRALPSAQSQQVTGKLNADCISRQAAIDALSMMQGIVAENGVRKGISLAWQQIKDLPSAQPELPKQFMSDDCISRSELYKKVCEAEKLARERVLDTPSDSPFPNKLNPAYTRYSAQLDERTQFKHMIADARSVQPDIIRCKDCKHRDPEDKKCDCGHDIQWQLPRDDDWYCADAERRTDENNNSI